ncbi:MAG: CDP-diacylglycerol--glycerol-3-phosphate 3-phosphatidyltransferase [Clostridia bacterium]|nr:CDP-diacylglycerol--glycerol-3-phosphate 3-phosphatidyltransferase [Clostridia bacterium]
MNTPNRITVFRMLIAPVFLLIYLSGIGHRFLISAVVFALGAVTDAVDGHLARKNNEITVFGQFLDPIADKMLVLAGLLALLRDGLCNIWIVMILLTRDFAVTSLRLIASARGVVIPANIGGKIKTVMQMVSFTAVLILAELKEFLFPAIPLAVISNILMALTAAASVISGAVYFAAGSRVIDFKE